MIIHTGCDCVITMRAGRSMAARHGHSGNTERPAWQSIVGTIGCHPMSHLSQWSRSFEDTKLADAYAYPVDRPWLRANMIASLDGSAWWGDRTGPLGDEGDRELFQLLRGLADVVIVGAETVRVEGYGPV